jgi:hypothetical protein
LGRNINLLRLPATSSDFESKAASIELQDVPDTLTADIVITDPAYLSYVLKPDRQENSIDVNAEQLKGTSGAYGIVILNQSLLLPQPAPSPSDLSTVLPETQADGTAEQTSATVMIIFPPRTAGKSAVRILQMGDETLSCPAGKCESFGHWYFVLLFLPYDYYYYYYYIQV